MKGTDMPDLRDPDTMAKVLMEALSARDIAITFPEALEIVTRQLGSATGNMSNAGLEKATSADLIAFERAVPIVRIFDIAKAHEFYLGFLGFSVDWEHRYGAEFPLYTQISRAGLQLHLSEHAGDATPGGTTVVYMTGIRTLNAELIAKNYRYMRPGLEKQEGRLEVTVIDPFGNRLRFMEVPGR